MGTFITILTLFPKILATVKAIEEFAPIPDKGKEKLDLFLAVAKEVGGDAEKLIPLITSIVGKVVAFGKAVGVFSGK